MSIDDELLLDAEDDAREVEFIMQYLPIELKEKMKEELVYYFLDLLEEYCIESDVLTKDEDDNGEIELDLAEIATYLVEKAKQDGIEKFTVEELIFFVDAELEYATSLS